MKEKIFIKDYWTTPEICLTCGKPGDYSILLAGDQEHLYLPNQFARDPNSMPLTEMWFCRSCMKKLENKFRGFLNELRSSQS
ncbi:MAG: hypothetical protein KatS3mg047_1067 [Bellilinea sp.]|nr:MAG: hypothetical protein KatS3mg047_1067 [Bellilinea sp.]